MKKQKKKTHGGRREGAGRKPTLESPSSVMIRLEQRQIQAIDLYGRERKLGTRSAALRSIVEEATKPKGEPDDRVA